jgi:hypothetical protein
MIGIGYERRRRQRLVGVVSVGKGVDDRTIRHQNRFKLLALPLRHGAEVESTGAREAAMNQWTVDGC